MNDTVTVERSGSAPAAERLESFTFTGRAGEYFGIWIVNVVLTILTLGIYSAWAKVRRQRYFYGNTFLAGSSFEYHARPTQILIGRIVVVALLIAYNVAANLFPLESLVLLALFVVATPWFIMRGLRFNARVTSFRNVRLDFTGGYWGAVKAFILAGLVAAISLGILAPLASRWSWRYVLGNLQYGGRPMACEPRLGALYRQWWLPALLVVIGFALFSVPAFLLLGAHTATSEETDAGSVAAFIGTLFLVIIGFALVYGVAGLFYQAGVRNVALNASVLDGRHRFVSKVSRRRYAWISITNFLATLATLSLARPWAAVRMARYLAAATAVHVSGSLEDYLSTVKDTGSAVGAEYMDIEGFDFGF